MSTFDSEVMTMLENVTNQWQEILKEQTALDYYKNLQAFLNTEYETKTIYPKKSDIFNALNYTDYDDVKVVLLGQDPYHGPNQAPVAKPVLAISLEEAIKLNFLLPLK